MCAAGAGALLDGLEALHVLQELPKKCYVTVNLPSVILGAGLKARPSSILMCLFPKLNSITLNLIKWIY